VCDCSDQAAHYHNLGPQLGASLLTRHIGWKQKQKVKKKKSVSYNLFIKLGGLVVSELAAGNKVSGMKRGRGQWKFKDDKTVV
jgi:hypothetical protein